MNGVVVADAGPLHYLILIDCAGLLPELFARVLIPPVVRDELLRQATPKKVKDGIANPPAWLNIEPVSRLLTVAHLHPGEAAALQLAVETKTPVVLMDDLDGRTAARQLGLLVVGTIGVLERMAENDLIELPATVVKLRLTNFFVSPKLLTGVLERDRRRKTP
jgi:predicted nucleic acid-binding protein